LRGHIKKRSTWQFTIDLGMQPLQRCPACRKRYWTKDGRLKRCPKCQGPLEEGLARRQEFHSGFLTKREAELGLAKAVGAIANGTHIEASRLLLDDFLKSQWLPAIRPTVRATTFMSYEGHIENHLIPALGRIPLQQLTASHINALYAKLLVENKKGQSERSGEGWWERGREKDASFSGYGKENPRHPAPSPSRCGPLEPHRT
jgi:hypothetical protein